MHAHRCMCMCCVGCTWVPLPLTLLLLTHEWACLLYYLARLQAKDELVHAVYAARDSELWTGCVAAGVAVREFGAWDAFAEEVLHGLVAARGL